MTNNSSKINNGDKQEYVTAQKDDNSEIVARNVTNEIGNQNRANKFFTALAAIGIIFAIYFVYIEIKKRRENNNADD